MNYSEAIHFLYDLSLFGAKSGLETTLRLAALAGDPHRRLRFIHVAGTNGKGSTCAMLESIYRAAGWRVGLFTSPHLVAFGERIQVNRQLIPEADVARLVTELAALLKHFPSTEPPTFFEFVTILALRYFAEQQCELVVWETGLGGRLDATNIVTPLASVITNVAFDHQAWLGDTLAKIAREKAGIIKPGVPVLTTAEAPDALAVIRSTAAALGSPLTVVHQVETKDDSSPMAAAHSLALAGAHQRLNAALALATVRALDEHFAVRDRYLEEGLTRVRWPGRFQVVPTDKKQTLVLDGAHNVAGAQCLRATVEEKLAGTRPVLILGVLRDKDFSAMCEVLAPLGDRIVLTPVQSERTAAPEELIAACRRASSSASITTATSLADALRQVEREPLVLITGSLYLVGEAMALLNLYPVPTRDERCLNEWGGVPRRG
jgi:dihydrofolate synthase/folylpolyglutamate synthase